MAKAGMSDVGDASEISGFPWEKPASSRDKPLEVELND
jgi:hypothetical protein